MREGFKAAAVVAQDGRLIHAALPRAFFAAQSFSVDFDREDVITGEPDDHTYYFHVIFYVIDDRADIIAQYKSEERRDEVFRELKEAVSDGQSYELPPIEEEKGDDSKC